MRATDAVVPLLVAAAAAAASDPRPDRLSLGSMVICRDRVVSATIGRDDLTGQPNLIVKLDDVGRATLAGLTGRRIGEPVPVRIGREVIMRPVVHERIAGGEFTISGPATAQLERARRATMLSCPAGKR